MLNRRYSVYSIKDGGARQARGISELRGQESMPWTHKSFIYKQGLISQPGRCGFAAVSVLGWNPLDVVDCQCLDLRIAALQPQSQNFPDSDDE